MQASPSPSPRVPANELRPGRHWYAVAAVIAVVLIALGAVLAAFRAGDAADAVDTGRPFLDGDTVSLWIEPGNDRAIWIEYRGPSDEQKCAITGPGEPRLTDPETDVHLTRDLTWNPLHGIDVSRPGDYEITCESVGRSRYAIGDRHGLLTAGFGLLAGALLAGLGIVAGATVALVTALRRRAHHKRLRAECTAPAPGEPSRSV